MEVPQSVIVLVETALLGSNHGVKVEGDRAVLFDSGWECGYTVFKKILRSFGRVKGSYVVLQNFVGGAIWGLDSIMRIFR